MQVPQNLCASCYGGRRANLAPIPKIVSDFWVGRRLTKSRSLRAGRDETTTVGVQGAELTSHPRSESCASGYAAGPDVRCARFSGPEGRHHPDLSGRYYLERRK